MHEPPPPTDQEALVSLDARQQVKSMAELPSALQAALSVLRGGAGGGGGSGGAGGSGPQPRAALADLLSGALGAAMEVD